MAFLGVEKSANRLWPSPSAFVSKNYAEPKKNWPHSGNRAQSYAFSKFLSILMSSLAFLFLFFTIRLENKKLYSNERKSG
jgi:hypothetical protein